MPVLMDKFIVKLCQENFVVKQKKYLASDSPNRLRTGPAQRQARMPDLSASKTEDTEAEADLAEVSEEDAEVAGEANIPKEEEMVVGKVIPEEEEAHLKLLTVQSL